MTIGAGGAATRVTCTPPTTTFFMSDVRTNCNDFCTSNINISIPRGTTNNDAYLNVAIGDTIAGSALTPGWYAFAASSTNTNDTGNFLQMQVDSNNQITSLAECDGQFCQII